MIYYKTIFGLAQHHKWSVTDIENMMPYERDIYVSLLRQHLEEERKKLENKQ